MLGQSASVIGSAAAPASTRGGSRPWAARRGGRRTGNWQSYGPVGRCPTTRTLASHRDVATYHLKVEAATMAKVIGIDLGTTNSAMAAHGGGRADRPRERRGQPDHALGRRDQPEDRRAPGRHPGPAPGDHQPGEHDLLDQALHGPQVRRPGRPGGDQARPLQGDAAPPTATCGSSWAARSTRRPRSPR